MEQTKKLTMQEAVLLHGRQLYGEQFNLDDRRRKQKYYDFALHFSGKPGELDPNKGVCITGKYGVGKSALFKVYQQIFHNYHIVTAEDIEKFLKEYGEIETLKKYGYLYQHNLVIDDIGSESQEVNIYKNSISIVGAILKERDRLMVDSIKWSQLPPEHSLYKPIIKTYATTNLTPQQLESFYGSQNYDRFRQMFTVTGWAGESLRK